MYIDVQQHASKILFRGFDKYGNLIQHKFPFEAELFLENVKENKKTEFFGFKTNKNLNKKNFDDYKKFNEFKENYKSIIYGNIAPIYQFIYNLKINEEQINLINPWSIDIEVYSKDEFPLPEKADKFPIVAITLSNIKKNKFYTWILDLNNKCTLKSEKNWEIKIFATEQVMLEDFLNFINQNINDIHIITGWNSNTYDIPYIIRRINYIFDGSIDIINKSKHLSPFKLIKQNYNNQLDYKIIGIPLLDYMELFKKYDYVARASYALAEIANEELGYGKLDHSQYITFAEFYDKNIDEYIRYNKHDTSLINELDKKFKFIELIINIAITCGINYVDVYSPIKCWEILIYNNLRKNNIILPPRKFSGKQTFQGAYVQKPTIGMLYDIVSYDLTSLYPSVDIALNISSETLIENEKDENATINNFLNNYIPINFHKENKIVCGAGNVYTKDKIGIMPELMDKLFKQRKIFKNKMFEAKKEKDRLKELLKE